MAKTVEQQRAAHAMQHVQHVRSGKEFVSLASGFPTMIHTNGLGQALAFCMGKKDEQYQEIVDMLSDWLCSEGKPFAGYDKQRILEAITSSPMEVYMRAQVEAMAYLLWVKKFAKALIGE